MSEKDVKELASQAEDVLDSTLEAVKEIRDRILELPVKPWFEVVLTGRVNDSLTRSWSVNCHFVDFKRNRRDEFLNLRTELSNGVGLGCSVEFVPEGVNILNVSFTKKGAPLCISGIAEEAEAFLQAVRNSWSVLDEAYSKAWVSEACRKLRRANVNLYHIEKDLASCEDEDDLD